MPGAGSRATFPYPVVETVVEHELERPLCGADTHPGCLAARQYVLRTSRLTLDGADRNEVDPMELGEQ